MAVFYRMDKDTLIREGFRFKAIAFGFIPVYISDPDYGGPLVVATRNYFPDWPLDIMEFLYARFLEIADPYGLSDAPHSFKITKSIL